MKMERGVFIREELGTGFLDVKKGGKERKRKKERFTKSMQFPTIGGSHLY